MHDCPVLPNDQMPSNALSLFVPQEPPHCIPLGHRQGSSLESDLGSRAKLRRAFMLSLHHWANAHPANMQRNYY